MRTSGRLWLLLLAGLVLLGASEWVATPAQTVSAADPVPISITGTVAADSGPADASTARLPTSHQPWNAIAEYTFDPDSHEISAADSAKAREVATRLRATPALRVGLDGTNARRVGAVRDALTGAGIPSFKIQVGAMGDPDLRADDRVAVLVID